MDRSGRNEQHVAGLQRHRRLAIERVLKRAFEDIDDLFAVMRVPGRQHAWRDRMSARPAVRQVAGAMGRYLLSQGRKLPAFLAQAELKPQSIQKVNVPRIWSLVTCVKE